MDWASQHTATLVFWKAGVISLPAVGDMALPLKTEASALKAEEQKYLCVGFLYFYRCCG